MVLMALAVLIQPALYGSQWGSSLGLLTMAKKPILFRAGRYMEEKGV
jgi:hypothetical protein